MMQAPVPSAELPPTDLDTPRLTSLVFELYSQLHAERVARIALQRALQTAGVLDPATLDGLAADPVVRDASLRASERSVAALLRTLQDSGDERRPLRPRDDGG
ncbi:MAG: hypothetical protein ABIT36_08035 [Steroidobacteraceae bacterium]